MDITFSTTRKQPPRIQRLAKHYLDLLGATNAPPEERGPVLYNDDKQVKLLHVSCLHHFDPAKHHEPGISVHGQSRADVIAEFEQVDDLGWLDPDFEDDFDDHLSALLTPRNGETWGLGDLDDALGDDLTPILGVLRMQDRQEEILTQADRIVGRALVWNARRLLTGGVPRRDQMNLELGDSTLVHQTHEIAAWNNLRSAISASFQVALPPLPLHPGNGAEFKSEARESCRRFLRRFAALQPLLVPLRVCILVVPPHPDLVGDDFIKDLDNVALDLMGVVEDEFGLLGDADSSGITQDAGSERRWHGELEKLRAVHPHGLSSFQVIELARTDSDGPEGWVALVPGHGWNWTSYWHEAARLNEQMLDRLEDRI